jgi:uridine kinase
MLQIPPEFSHSLELTLGYLTFALSLTNKGFWEGLGKTLGAEKAKELEKIGKIVGIKLDVPKDDQKRMWQESPEQFVNTVAMALQEKELLETLKSQMQYGSIPKIIIGISGGSCSGKTWIAHQFKNLCPENVCLFELDGYYKALNIVNGKEFTHDNPDSIDHIQISSDLATLKAGKEVVVPQYNLATQKMEGSKICIPTPILIVEGLFAFSNPAILKLFDFKVWVKTDSHIRYDRRFERDQKERSRTPDSINDKWKKNVEPGYDKFTRFNQRYADITIHNNDDEAIPKGLYALLAYCGVDISTFEI